MTPRKRSRRNGPGHRPTAPIGFGTRFSSRFAGLGLKEDIPGLRGYPAKSTDLPLRKRTKKAGKK
jgi:hypothetical protein